MAYDLYDTPALPYAVRIMLAAVTTFSVSYMLVWIMSRTRITEIFIK